MANQETGSLEALSRTAARLRPWAFPGEPLPRLLFFTDPVRVPDPEAVAERLPAGAGIVYRPFDARDAVERGLRLARIAHRRGLLLLAGADPLLAEAIGAGGVHLPQRLAPGAPGIRSAHSSWRITAAAHDEEAVRAAEVAGVEAVVVSPAFPSSSPSAGAPLGVAGLAAITAGAALPVYALGGVNAKTADALIGAGVYGLAGIEGFGA
ncbi:thiamine phosphate synthase [Caulobacter endophyticus]|uniref:Thiamine monophosphate synthase n=1 Tax=Caulobacter endophyticus TaxID=2172652 RepID=A0A2T9K282_9CAUL|nr:thiamine phosphate synthase [Caulobacter endophyticus]PVM89903.1 thiamine monophosphate synthase [Caulobacter endophyticus]